MRIWWLRWRSFMGWITWTSPSQHDLVNTTPEGPNCQQQSPILCIFPGTANQPAVWRKMTICGFLPSLWVCDTYTGMNFILNLHMIALPVCKFTNYFNTQWCTPKQWLNLFLKKWNMDWCLWNSLAYNTEAAALIKWMINWTIEDPI